MTKIRFSLKLIMLIAFVLSVFVLLYFTFIEKNLYHTFLTIEAGIAISVCFVFVFIIIKFVGTLQNKNKQKSELQHRHFLRDIFEKNIQARFSEKWRKSHQVKLEKFEPNPLGFDKPADPHWTKYGKNKHKKSEEDQQKTVDPETTKLKLALQVLGISEDDLNKTNMGIDDLNKFYHLRSCLYHPDKFFGADEKQKKWATKKMAELNEAKSLVFTIIQGE